MKRAKVTKDSEAYIREHLEVDSCVSSGLKWKKAPKFNGHMLGKEAGVKTTDGYFRVGVKRQKLSTHRVIWFLLNGDWPHCIDHIDGNQANNSPENLRSVTLSENQHNRICSGVIRAGLAMAKNGVNLPDNFSDMGMAGMAKVGLEMVAQISPDEARPLLDELMKCIQFVPDPTNQSIKRGLIDDDTEEVVTRLKLRSEVFKLHVDFFATVAG